MGPVGGSRFPQQPAGAPGPLGANTELGLCGVDQLNWAGQRSASPEYSCTSPLERCVLVLSLSASDPDTFPSPLPGRTEETRNSCIMSFVCDG